MEAKPKATTSSSPHREYIAIPLSAEVSRVEDASESDDSQINLHHRRDETGIPDLIRRVTEIALGGGTLPISGSGDDAFIKFQLIPVCDTPGKTAVGEVVERKLKEKSVIKIGRQVIRDGQATIKGTKKATELDIWFTSKVVSRLHAEIWTKDGQLCVKDVSSSSGTFLNGMRLSPSGKESRPYNLKPGDVLKFGVDFKGRAEDIYRALTMKVGFHDQSWLISQRKNANPQRFSIALKQLIAATNPYGDSKEVDIKDTSDTDCCICIGPIAPFQALFIAPCSHCYHFKCVSSLVEQSPMFQCPLCRQVANLTASISMDSLHASQNQLVILPVLEEIIERTDVQSPISVANHTTARRPSLQAGKRFLETLRIIPPSTNIDLVSPLSLDVISPAPISSDKKKKRSFSFRLRGFGGRASVGEESTPRNVAPDDDERSSEYFQTPFAESLLENQE